MKRPVKIKICDNESSESVEALVPDMSEVKTQLRKLGIPGRYMYLVNKAVKDGEKRFEVDLDDAMLYVSYIPWLRHLTMTANIRLKSFYLRTKGRIWASFLISFHKFKRLFRRSARS